MQLNLRSLRSRFVAIFTFALLGAAAAKCGAMTIVENGVNAAPIILPPDTTYYNRVAAEDLASMIERASGARPEIIEGAPQEMPNRAIWVGYQPAMEQAFPGVSFSFEKPEEILIAANRNHLAIVGRDCWIDGHTEFITTRKNLPGRQLEYGTVNAVYSFLRDQMGVRWLFPGELGIDVPQQATIVIHPMEYRYAPQFRVRSTIFAPWAPAGGRQNAPFQDWFRRQRLWLDSLELPGGHAFTTWWDAYHDEHPDYFALQPDGTRSGFPNPKNVKLCVSNPAVWQRWLEEVEKIIERDPTQRVFSAASNDGWSAGHCVCDNCRAWDHPDGELLTYTWQGLSQDYVALTDREVTFANTLARMLAERYPDRDYYVQIHAYGLSRPAPVGVTPDDNVIVSSVANFILRPPEIREGHITQFGEWGAKTKNLMWRPNFGSTFGWAWGTPDIALQQVGEDFRFVADNGGMGVFFDMVWDHWGNQGPLYYLFAHLAWNPYLDVNAVMDDYYQRMYGPAAATMKAYWTKLENVRMDAVNQGLGQLAVNRAYTDEVIAELDGLIAIATEQLADAPQVYRQRLEHTSSAWNYAKRIFAIRRAMIRYEISNNADTEAAAEVIATWEQIMSERSTLDPEIVSFVRIANPDRNRRMNGLHPENPSAYGARLRLEASREEWAQTEFTDALSAGWEPVFTETFDRTELGDMWEIIEGTWRVEDGTLIGSGMIASTVGFPNTPPPGYQRLEFTVSNYVEPGSAISDNKLAVSDFSAMLHLPAPDLYSTVPWTNCYFFQFGGQLNTANRILRHSKAIADDRTPSVLIDPNETYHIVAENDNGQLRLWVNQQLVLAGEEKDARIGTNYDRIGFYIFTTAKIDDIKVYTKRLPDDLDLN